MRRLTILVDLDDVMWDFLTPWVVQLNRMSGRSISVFDLTEWRVNKFYPGLSEKKMLHPLSRNFFWDHIKPMPGAQETIKRLIDDGHRIVVVTASHPDTVKYKARKLFKLFPYISCDDLIIAKDKSLIFGDVMIDDGPHNLERTSCMPVLFSRPHNLQYPAYQAGWKRVSSWKEVYRLIQDVAA